MQWISASIYRARYDVDTNRINLYDIDVMVAGFEDAAGNQGNSITDMDVFDIDTRSPQVLNVIPSSIIVFDGDTGTATFQILVEFDEMMDTSIAPLLTFPGANPSPSLASNNAASGWTGIMDYAFLFDVSDLNLETGMFDVLISQGADPSQNITKDFLANALFAIDTRNPQVIALTPSSATVTNSHIGNGWFRIYDSVR